MWLACGHMRAAVRPGSQEWRRSLLQGEANSQLGKPSKYILIWLICGSFSPSISTSNFFMLIKEKRVVAEILNYVFIRFMSKVVITALAGWLSGFEHPPTHQKVAGLIPFQGTYPGWGFYPPSRCMQEATDWCFSLTSMFLSLPSTLSKINKHPWVRIKKKKKAVTISQEYSWEATTTLANCRSEMPFWVYHVPGCAGEESLRSEHQDTRRNGGDPENFSKQRFAFLTLSCIWTVPCLSWPGPETLEMG